VSSAESDSSTDSAPELLETGVWEDPDDPTADLTNAERKVLDLIGDGLSNREIGERLGVAEKTVKNHITSLLAKMGLQRRTQVAAWVAGQRASGWRNS